MKTSKKLLSIIITVFILLGLFTVSAAAFEFEKLYLAKNPTITAFESTDDGVLIVWGDVDLASKYRVYYKGRNGWTKMGDTYNNYFVDTDVSSGSTYTYTVRCINDAGTEFESNYNKTGWKYTYNMQTPEITSMEDTPNGVNIKWDPVPNATKYRVYYYGSRGWTKMAETDKTSYLDKDVSYGSTYTYTVRCVNAAGNRFTSDCNSKGWKHTYYLDTPQITGFESVGKGVKITWDKIAGAQQYRVYYYGSKGWTKMGESTGTSFIDDDVNVGSTYRYTVRCINSSLTKFTSDCNSTGWRYKYDPKLDTPKITSIEAERNGLNIKWSSVSGADVYRVYYYGSKGWTRMADVRGTSYLDTDVSTGHQYTYTVRCLSSKSKGFASDYERDGKKFYYCDIPIVQKLTIDSRGMQVKWDKVYGAYQYRVFRKHDGGSWERVGTVSDTSIIDTEVQPFTEYTYTVRAVSPDDTYSSWFDGNGLTFAYNTYAIHPGIACLMLDKDKNLYIEVDPIAGIDSYVLYIKQKSGWGSVMGFTGTRVYDEEKGRDAVIAYIEAPMDTLTYRFYCFTITGIDEDGNQITDYFDDPGYDIILVEPAGEINVTKTGDRTYNFTADGMESFDTSYLILTGEDPVSGEEYNIEIENYVQKLTVDLSEYPDDIEWTCVVYGGDNYGRGKGYPSTMTFKEADYQ